jgi:hypothetical protein
MSEKKTIQFNPDFLKFTNNKTRKKQSNNANSADNIKIRSARPKKRDETFKKNSILRMIRKHQQEKYNQMLESFEKPQSKKTVNETTASFQSDFEQSKQFLDKMIEENSFKQSLHNHTLKQPVSIHAYSETRYPLENVSQTISTPHTITEQPVIIQPPKTASNVLQSPQYGCLKNGQLPTYRNWFNRTQKATSNSVLDHATVTNQNAVRANELSQKIEKINVRQDVKKNRKKPKQKRIIRRTFKIGKSKVIPKVSVLISNRSIRNKVSTDGQLLKQKPIEEIKKYLIKHGLIRVGTTAPNDVLRKMYECSVMMCGEVQNHNPDNLLYNFLNSDV